MPHNRIDSSSTRNTYYPLQVTHDSPGLLPKVLTSVLKKTRSAEGVKAIWWMHGKQFNEIHYSAMWTSLASKKASIESEADSRLLQATYKQFGRNDSRGLSNIANALSHIPVKGQICLDELALCWKELASSVLDAK